jgi:hypothetical protein
VYCFSALLPPLVVIFKRDPPSRFFSACLRGHKGLEFRVTTAPKWTGSADPQDLEDALQGCVALQVPLWNPKEILACLIGRCRARAPPPLHLVTKQRLQY